MVNIRRQRERRPIESTEKSTPSIGTLNEKPLHESLKRWYSAPGDETEVKVDGFIIDIVHNGLLVEVQTRNFTAIRRKLEKLLTNHRVRLVYPIPGEKWIVKQAAAGVTRRKSPKRGTFIDVFNELVRCPLLLAHPGFSLELILVREEEVRSFDGVRGWRRGGWITSERRLLEVMDRHLLESPEDMLSFLPSGLSTPFTAKDVAAALGRPARTAQKVVYCLKHVGCIEAVGKRAKSVIYTVVG